ncbi:EthD domain-containing protein [Mycobacterium sp. pUA109]|uniref:EthD domain-containing protein n=1 Tax=Mycobacterium sp. pUA109 TaxID=3238982 RepID=UPI00351B51A8
MKSPTSIGRLLISPVDDRKDLIASLSTVVQQRSKTQLQASVRLADDPTRTDHRSGGGAAPSFEAVVDILEGDPDVTAAVLADIDGVDLARSAVIVGHEHRLLSEEPDARLRLVLALRRQPTLSRGQCHDYWLNHHAPLAITMPGLAGYRQLHTDPDATAQVATRSGIGHADFDGAASISFTSLAAFTSTMAQPEIAETAYEDEKRFIDHSRSSLGLFELLI